MVNLNVNNHSLASVKISNNRNNLDEQHAGYWLTLQTTLRLAQCNMEKRTQKFTSKPPQIHHIKLPGERHCLLYIEDVSQNHPSSHKGRKPRQKFYMIIPTLNNYSPFICRIVLNRLWSNIT